jgi:CRP-like cAMP-binding protein
MARDARLLREEATEATASGKYKRALAAYLELERLEPRDAQWSKRAAETYRRLGKEKDAVQAYARAADRYAQNGFLVQAIAVCKLILQVDPKNDDALRRISSMNEQIGAGPTRAATIADNNPGLAENQAVAALRRTPTEGASGSYSTGSIPVVEEAKPAGPVTMSRTRTRTPTQGTQVQSRTRTPTSIPPVNLPRTRTPNSDSGLSVSRTKSKPVTVPPGEGIESVKLSEAVPNAYEREESSGVYVIPIDEEVLVMEDYESEPESERPSVPMIEVEYPSPVEVEPEESTELELTDLEEIPLPEPRALGVAAALALSKTPLFAGLPREALESLVEQLQLVELPSGDVLFKEGDAGDALYVIVEGEVSVSAEGPPRVEMARLGPGSFIGEVALMTDQPRSATVSATVDSELLRIDRKTLASVLSAHGEVLSALLRFVRDRLVDRWMRTSPLLRPFPESERAHLANRFSFLECDPGSKLLGAGQKPDGLYIVLAGNFSVRRGGKDIVTLGPGDLIGETALLSGGAFRSDVMAKGKALALCLPAADFREMIMTHPHVLEYIGEAAEHSRKLQIL